MNTTAKDNKEYARVLGEWLDTLVMTGSTGRRAVFVERSLKRHYHKTIQSALKMTIRHVPSNWACGLNYNYTKRLDSWIQQALWHLTVEISRKFKAETPVELNFRQIMSKI